MTKIGRKLKKNKKRAGLLTGPLLKKAQKYYQARDWKAADAVCRDILSKDPTNHQALHLLSITLIEQPNLVAAEKFIKKAIKIKPNNPLYYNVLGHILTEQQKLEAGLGAFEKAFSLDPQNVLTNCNLGLLHKSFKKTEQAEEYFRKVLRLDPNHGKAASSLCQLLSRQPARREELNEVIRYMEELVSNPECSTIEDVYYELARAHDRLGNYEKVFNFLEPANRICRSRFEYDVESDLQFFQAIAQNFTQGLLKRKLECGSDDSSPIFILGMPRSGTTLVEQILGSHSQIFAGGELYYLKYLILQCPMLKVPFHPNTISNPAYSQIAKVPKSELKNLAEAYIKAITPLKKNKKHITDKMPHNFIHVGMIRLLFPNSKVIHCRRASMDNCLSLYMRNFTSLHPYIYSQEEIARYYVGYCKLMDHWQTLLPGFIHEIHYEKLVNNPEQEIKKLLTFCNLDWEKNCLEFYKLDRVIKTSSEGQADQPLYKTSIDRWKRYESELQPIYNILKEAKLLTKPEMS